MKTTFRICYLILIYSLLTIFARAGEGSGAAPYFQVTGGGGDEVADECLPLKSSAAKVVIQGTIASVTLTQCYGNTGKTPIEALYVFPASTRAAVHGMTLRTGGRVIAARIRESEAARTEYRKAKRDGKTAALLEQHRSNVFQMSVANLLPGDDIEVEVVWTETVPALNGEYEFVFPTVTGPRYTGGSTDANPPAWAANPYLKTGSSNPAKLSLDVSLQSALPLAEVTCASHPVAVDFKSRDSAGIRLDTRNGGDAANRDFILHWKLGGNAMDAGLLLHKGEKSNHFLLQIAPPETVRLSDIPPRDYVMVLDVSGSMEGFPLDTAKALLHDLIKSLRPTDTFNVLCFASGNGSLSEHPLPATPANLDAARRFIETQNSGGGTELEAALHRAIALPGGDDRSRSILLVTDGYVTADQSARDLVRENIGSANLFVFGIGSSVNRELVESLARAGGGEPAVITRTSEAGPAAARFLEQISSPVLAKIRVLANGVEIDRLEASHVPDLFARRPLVVQGTWKGEPRGTITIQGIAGSGETFEKNLDLAEAAAKSGLVHSALPVLWARERVRRLVENPDRDPEATGEITRLGLEHSLLTPYTSFVAVDETPREIIAASKTVTQPLPLPQGVGEGAICTVGSPVVSNGSVPEPGAVGLISVLVVLLALQRRRD
jgi:Ca-activated chloride channel homolog